MPTTDPVPTAEDLAFLESQPDISNAALNVLGWYRDLLTRYTETLEQGNVVAEGLLKANARIRAVVLGEGHRYIDYTPTEEDMRAADWICEATP